MVYKWSISTFLVLILTLTSVANVFLDFDGDGKTDPTLLSSQITGEIWQVYWHNLYSNNGGYAVTAWGAADMSPGGFGDFFVPADYDGDGKTDFAVWRRPNESPPTQFGRQCYFYILYSATGTYDVIPWGRSPNATYTDEPIPQDYDGDGKTDLAIKRSNAQGIFWFILQPGRPPC